MRVLEKYSIINPSGVPVSMTPDWDDRPWIVVFKTLQRADEVRIRRGVDGELVKKVDSNIVAICRQHGICCNDGYFLEVTE